MTILSGILHEIVYILYWYTYVFIVYNVEYKLITVLIMNNWLNLKYEI